MFIEPTLQIVSGALKERNVCFCCRRHFAPTELGIILSLASYKHCAALRLSALADARATAQSAALPSDVRWRLCPTVKRASTVWGCAPMSGRSPEESKDWVVGRSETFRTSGGAAARSVLIGVSTLGTRDRKCAATE